MRALNVKKMAPQVNSAFERISKNVFEAIQDGVITADEVSKLYEEKGRKITMSDISSIQNNQNGNQNQKTEVNIDQTSEEE